MCRQGCFGCILEDDSFGGCPGDNVFAMYWRNRLMIFIYLWTIYTLNGKLFRFFPIQRFIIYCISFMFDVVNITGFQAFGNVQVNPTELVVNELKKNPHIKLRRIQKLDVTVKAVDTYINYLANSCNPKQGRTLNLHMGVGPNKVYFLEQSGYNNKDFRIPDNDGLFCKNEKICPDYKLDQPIDTKINLQWLSEELRKKGHKIDLSKDPGRYLCNYIYFNSLQKVCGDHCTSLFVHFPDLQYTTNEQNVKFVTDLINVLTTKK